MPKQDAQGRWVSDDNRQYWDGNAWVPVPGTTAAPRRGISAVPAVLIGCGFALVIAIVLVIGVAVYALNNADFQRGFCDSWNNNAQDQGTPCPFHPSSP